MGVLHSLVEAVVELGNNDKNDVSGNAALSSRSCFPDHIFEQIAEGRDGELAGGEGRGGGARRILGSGFAVAGRRARRRARQPSDRRPICRRLRVRPASASASSPGDLGPLH
ncbi:unnamed protein product [Camellia sinensis]